MQKEVYEAKIFELKASPETGKETVCLEIELDRFDFDKFKEYWVDNETITVKFIK